MGQETGDRELGAENWDRELQRELGQGTGNLGQATRGRDRELGTGNWGQGSGGINWGQDLGQGTGDKGRESCTNDPGTFQTTVVFGQFEIPRALEAEKNNFMAVPSCVSKSLKHYFGSSRACFAAGAGGTIGRRWQNAR